MELQTCFFLTGPFTPQLPQLPQLLQGALRKERPGTKACAGLADTSHKVARKGFVILASSSQQGTSWLHVGTDQPFVSVTIGMFHQVWAVAQDGSAFCRGECWYHVPSPLKQKLKQVSVGRTAVLAVICGFVPESHRVTLKDLIWVIADKVQGSHSLSCGTVCHRTGIQPLEPKGASWDYGIGGGWEHITVRGNATERTKMASQDGPSSSPQDLSSLEVDGSYQPRSTIFVDGVQGLDRNAVQC
ncbi:hypothetical protein E2320_012173 [Naja naja]|nr:hypothetical protein E2320_012173 [Naja naja]